MLASQLSVPEFFPPTCLGKGRTVCCGALPPRSPITPDCADEGRVHGKLGSVEERQTVRDDLQAAFINANSRKKVKILDADVRGHPGRPARRSPPEGSLVVRAPLMSCKLHGGGHVNRVVGHTSRKRTRGETGTRGGAREGPGNTEDQNAK